MNRSIPFVIYTEGTATLVLLPKDTGEAMAAAAAAVSDGTVEMLMGEGW